MSGANPFVAATGLTVRSVEYSREGHPVVIGFFGTDFELVRLADRWGVRGYNGQDLTSEVLSQVAAERRQRAEELRMRVAATLVEADVIDKVLAALERLR